MEAHKCICEAIRCFTCDFCIIHIAGNGVVNIKKSNCVITYTSADIFRQNAVNINLA